MSGESVSHGTTPSLIDRVGEEAILDDVRHVAETVNRAPTTAQMKDLSEYGYQAVVNSIAPNGHPSREIGQWGAVLLAAGIRPPGRSIMVGIARFERSLMSWKNPEQIRDRYIPGYIEPNLVGSILRKMENEPIWGLSAERWRDVNKPSWQVFIA